MVALGTGGGGVFAGEVFVPDRKDTAPAGEDFLGGGGGGGILDDETRDEEGGVGGGNLGRSS